METRAFGRTGLSVSALGFGAGQLGASHLSERDVDALLGAVLDEGVTLFDSARSYGASEERLGRHLAGRRDRVVLSTKGGYGVAGVADWSAEAIARGVDEALVRLRTDRIDLFHLHSCPLEVLRRDENLRALERAQAAGKLRVVAYSGDNDALAWAVASGRFGGLQCSVNPFDQRSLEATLPAARDRGLGVLAKRPLGNAPWRYPAPPADDGERTYWLRMRELALDPAPLDWAELTLRFSAFADGVSSIIVGTTSLAHVRANVTRLSRGPLDAPLLGRVRAAFSARGRDWPGLI
jgi:aryl-alcohol dehydrogenase-like predicted oxidoreductase